MIRILGSYSIIIKDKLIEIVGFLRDKVDIIEFRSYLK